MSRPTRWPLLSAALLLALTGCAVTPPVTSVTPVATPSVVSPVATPTVSTPPATASPSPTESAPATTVQLAGNGLGGLKFGTAEKSVTKLLSDRLGTPDERMEGVLCELNDAAPWAVTITYGGLWVQFQAKTASKKAPRTLTAWGFQLVEPFQAPLVMADDVPLDLDFDELVAQFPDGKLSPSELGDGGQIFTLADGITFIGTGQPDTVMAGQLSYCD